MLADELAKVFATAAVEAQIVHQKEGMQDASRQCAQQCNLTRQHPFALNRAKLLLMHAMAA